FVLFSKPWRPRPTRFSSSTTSGKMCGRRARQDGEPKASIIVAIPQRKYAVFSRSTGPSRSVSLDHGFAAQLNADGTAARLEGVAVALAQAEQRRRGPAVGVDVVVPTALVVASARIAHVEQGVRAAWCGELHVDPAVVEL